MRIALFGSTGMLGQHVAKACLDAGHTVTTLVRDPAKLGEMASHMTVVQGDYFDATNQKRTVEGADAVLTTIGPPLNREPNQGEYTQAMQTLIAAMQDASVKRIIAVGGAGLRIGNEDLHLPRRIMRFILKTRAGAGYLDKENEHNLLAKSSLDWTILRPPQIKDTTGTLTPTQEKVAGFTADAAQIASFMLASLNDQSTFQTKPYIATV